MKPIVRGGKWQRNLEIATKRRLVPRPRLSDLAAEYGINKERIRQICAHEERVAANDRLRASLPPTPEVPLPPPDMRLLINQPELGTRSWRCLTHDRIETTDELLKFVDTYGDAWTIHMLRIPNLGKGSLAEIVALVGRLRTGQ